MQSVFPDLLGGPQDHALAYTGAELKALGIEDLLNRESVYDEESLYRTIVCPVDEEIRASRMEMARFLRNLPERQDWNEWVDALPKGQQYRERKRGTANQHAEMMYDRVCLVKLSDNLQRIQSVIGHESFEVVQKLQRLCTQILETDGFVSTCREITSYSSAHQNGDADWQYAIHNAVGYDPNISATQQSSVRKLEKYYPMIEGAGELRSQLRAYQLMTGFSRDFCIPEIQDSPGKTGVLEGAIHDAYTKDRYTAGKKKPVPNTISWHGAQPLTFITGHGSLGKTTYLRTLGMNVLQTMAGFLPTARSARMSRVRRVWPYIISGDMYDAGSFEKQELYKRRLCELATADDLLLIDQPSQGTEQNAVHDLSRAFIRDFILEVGIPSFVVTHDLDLVRQFKDRSDVRSLRVAGEGEPLFTMHEGIADRGYGMTHAKKLQTDSRSLKMLVKERRKKGEL